MEPRLNALLDISTQDNASMMSSSGTASPGTERPSHHADPTFVRPKALMLGNSLPENSQANDIRKESQDRTFPMRAMPSAPIAHVLNDEGNLLSAQSVPTTFTSSSTTPFSGRLVDLLLDSPEHSRQRWDQDQQFLQPENTGYSPSVIKLPRLPQPPKRTAKRPRIPPLLQGLHQPPPLPPEGRLFPPITGEKNAFAGDRGYDSLFDESRTKDVDDHAFLENGTQELGRINQHGETMSLSQPGAQNAFANSTAAVPETDVLTNKATTAPNQAPVKRGKKRNRWSEQETKDLLVGVSKFGIGNWKKILQSPDFAFHNRTAVDLKDRFRVCCPGEGLKPRQPKAKGKEKKDHVPSEPSVDASPAHQQPLPSNAENSASTRTIASPKQTGSQQRAPPRNKTVIPNLAELGIREPFSKTTRRPRRAFSANDDMNLLKGFEKYGPVWHFMRDDAELDFGTRHPTDLRDRFRIRYPEKYAKAGYKLKAKEKERSMEKQAHEQEKTDHHSTKPDDSAMQTTSSSSSSQLHRPSQSYSSDITKDMYPSTGYGTTMSSHLSNSSLSLKAFASSTYLSDPLPTLPFDDENLVDDMGNGDESPITLSRNILRWADANPSSLFTSMTQASSSGAAVNQHAGTLNPPERPLGTSMFGGNDGLHGNFGFTTQSQSQSQSQMDGARSGSLAEADAWLSASSERMSRATYTYRA